MPVRSRPAFEPTGSPTFAHEVVMRRTRLSVCFRKARFAIGDDALAAAARADFPLRVYRCDRCWQFHLTSRTKGKRKPPPWAAKDAHA